MRNTYVADGSSHSFRTHSQHIMRGDTEVGCLVQNPDLNHLRTIASFSILSTSSARYRTPRPSFMNGRIPAFSRRFSVMVEHCTFQPESGGCSVFGFSSYSSPVPPLPSFVFTLAATGTTLSISMFSSAEYSVWRAVWNSLVGLNTAFALSAAPALCRANMA